MSVLGVLAGILTTGCWLPQLARSWRTRSVGDISWFYLLALASGVALWVAYGASQGDLPIVLTNAATGAALLTLSVMKLRYRQEDTA
ncbi:SemiSWEET family sugar transporter [Dactylosporangium sp. NPDC000521]|uniref:SemiSWEET family sugar transporter n=1 Tax=Dactylosporangium sp. NPDC000521 TaxID=3363975 RepID=UPI0036954DF3